VGWSSAYTAFGQPIAINGSTRNHYQWGAASGYRSDGFGPTYASPLLKVGARYYGPEFGCFMTRDTDLSQAAYAYCDGDPVNLSDPSGHDDGNPPLNKDRSLAVVAIGVGIIALVAIPAVPVVVVFVGLAAVGVGIGAFARNVHDDRNPHDPVDRPKKNGGVPGAIGDTASLSSNQDYVLRGGKEYRSGAPYPGSPHYSPVPKGAVYGN